jgi:hypothetical protein
MVPFLVDVKMDIMTILLTLSVHNVTLNVLLVILMNIVSLVLLTEKTHQTVHVFTICGVTIGSVKTVHTNVMVVMDPQPTVKNVKKTELKNHLVTVHPDSMMMVLIPYVQNVTVNVILVLEVPLVVYSVPVSEKVIIVTVQPVTINHLLYLSELVTI